MKVPIIRKSYYTALNRSPRVDDLLQVPLFSGTSSPLFPFKPHLEELFILCLVL